MSVQDMIDDLVENSAESNGWRTDSAAAEQEREWLIGQGEEYIRQAHAELG